MGIHRGRSTRCDCLSASCLLLSTACVVPSTSQYVRTRVKLRLLPTIAKLFMWYRQWHGSGETSDAVQLATCTSAELHQLQQCCQALMQTISERLEAISFLKMEEHSRHGGSCPRERCVLHAPACGFLRSSSGVPSSFTARELDSNLGLWQALPQELFPSKRTSNHRFDVSSREGSQQPTSPSTLSVTTAPSDGGTITLGRPFTEPSSVHSVSRGPHGTSLAPHEPCPQNPASYVLQQDMEHSILSTHIKDAAASPTISYTAVSDSRGLWQPCTCPPLLDNASRDPPAPGIPVGGAALNAVPECNSSLETPDSYGLTQSSSRLLKSAQSVMQCNSVLQSFTESPAEHIVAHRSVRTSADGSGSDVGCTVSTVPYRNRGSSTSSTQSARSQSRRRGGGDAAAMVQYGFQSPSTSYVTSSVANLADQALPACANAHPHSRLTVGTGAPRVGLLSASLSRCASQCTSPHAVSPTVPTSAPALTLPAKLAPLSLTPRTLDSAAFSPRSSVRSPSGGSLRKGSTFVIPSCSPAALHCARSAVFEGTTSTASGCSPGDAVASPVSVVSAVIPPALQMQMMTMGYHRPSRVDVEAMQS